MCQFICKFSYFKIILEENRSQFLWEAEGASQFQLAVTEHVGHTRQRGHALPYGGVGRIVVNLLLCKC